MKPGESKADKQVIADEAAAEVVYQADEKKAKAPVKVVPKVELASSFQNRAEFNAAVAGHLGDECITLNGVTMRISAGSWVHYFTHSPDGVINTTPPNN